MIFRRKAVRDLHWVMASSHLLADPVDGHATLPTLSDRLCAAIVDASLPWLRELERFPEELERWLSRQRNVRRLGFYFASLLEYWVRFCPLLAEPGAPVLTQQQVHLGLSGGVSSPAWYMSLPCS